MSCDGNKQSGLTGICAAHPESGTDRTELTEVFDSAKYRAQHNPFRLRYEKAKLALDRIEAKMASRRKNDMPGTAITGASGITASRRRKLDRQLDSYITLAKTWKELKGKVNSLESKMNAYASGKIDIQGRAISEKPKVKAKKKPIRDWTPQERVFIGGTVTGWSFADKAKERNSDYGHIGILFYDTLEWRPAKDNPQMPPEVEAYVQEKIEKLRALKGTFDSDASGSRRSLIGWKALMNETGKDHDTLWREALELEKEFDTKRN